MIAESLHAYLSGHAGVSVLVGSRVFPLMIPQHVYNEATKQPCLVYQLIGTTRDLTFCAVDQLVSGSYQIDAYARKYKQANELARAVRAALIDFSGLMGDTHVRRIMLDTEQDLLDPEPGLYRVSQTYTIWYLEQ
jgi:capsular polysaccharide biosynthesis protein